MEALNAGGTENKETLLPFRNRDPPTALGTAETVQIPSCATVRDSRQRAMSNSIDQSHGAEARVAHSAISSLRDSTFQSMQST